MLACRQLGHVVSEALAALVAATVMNTGHARRRGVRRRIFGVCGQLSGRLTVDDHFFEGLKCVDRSNAFGTIRFHLIHHLSLQ